jgi:hypothetical protein
MSDAFKNRIIGSGEERPDQLLASPQNHRVHPFFQQNVMTEILEKVGWVQQIIVNRRTNTVIDGHMRVMLALRRSERVVPVLYVDLTPPEEALILAAYDKVGRLALQDGTMLEELLVDITDSFNDIGPSLSQMLSDMQGTITNNSFYVKENGAGVDQPAKIGDNSGEINRVGGEVIAKDSTEPKKDGLFISYKVPKHLQDRWQALWQVLPGGDEERLSHILDLATRQLIAETQQGG